MPQRFLGVPITVVMLLIIVATPLAAVMVSADTTCRFAPLFETNALLENKNERDRFYEALVTMESKFMHFAGIDPPTMMTRDGQPLDVKSGLPDGLPPHMFSAPSKESLHLAVLAQAIDGNPLALAAYGQNTTEVLRILHQKVETYESFNLKYPGFGGFLPWFAVDGKGGMDPTWDWVNKVPSLDNGEFFWSVFAVAEALRHNLPHETKLIAAYEVVWRRMIENAIAVFYDEKANGFRTVTQMTNQSWPVSRNKYSGTGGDNAAPGLLNDPYEGELFVVAMYLFSDKLSDAQKEMLWVVKREMLQRVELVLPLSPSSSSASAFSSTRKEEKTKIGGGSSPPRDAPLHPPLPPPRRRNHRPASAMKVSAEVNAMAKRDKKEGNKAHTKEEEEEEDIRITVERGFWFSAHEKWKYLFLPYHKAANNWRVFLNGERARTHYARYVKAKGLWASVNGPITANNQNGGYFSDCGIQPIAFNNVSHDDVITPYGAFPLFLVREYGQKKKNTNQKPDSSAASAAPNAEGVAAAWLHHMISVRQGQNCYGTTEGFNVSGTANAPLVTWDTKITSLVAIMGGNVDIIARGLDRLNVTNKFVAIVDREWGRVFGDAVTAANGGNGSWAPLPGEELPFLGPDVNFAVPKILADFTSCSEDSPPCVY